MERVTILILLLLAAPVSAAPLWNPVVGEKVMSCEQLQVSFKIQKQFLSDPQILWKHPKHTQSEWELFNGFPVQGWNMQVAVKNCSVGDSRVQCIVTDPINPRIIVQTINFYIGKFVVAEDDYPPMTFECY